MRGGGGGGLSEPPPPTPQNTTREAARRLIQSEHAVDVQTQIAGARVEPTPLFGTPLRCAGGGYPVPTPPGCHFSRYGGQIALPKRGGAGAETWNRSHSGR